jgi:hypothetical protein
MSQARIPSCVGFIVLLISGLLKNDLELCLWFFWFICLVNELVFLKMSFSQLQVDMNRADWVKLYDWFRFPCYTVQVQYGNMMHLSQI